MKETVRNSVLFFKRFFFIEIIINIVRGIFLNVILT